MIEQEDDQLTRLLRHHEPPARDPLFRIRVLERRERKRFRQELSLIIGAVVAATAIAAFGVNAGGALEVVARVALLGIAVTTAAVGYARAIGALFGRVRI
jgi:hypothetical protein